MKSECRERKRLGAVVSFFLILSLILLQAGRLPAAETKTPGQENPSAAAELVKSLQEKLEAERKSIGALKEELAKAQRMRKSVEAEINAFTVQCSAYKNLLLLPTIQTSDLRKIQTNLNAALTEINTRISQLKEESKGLSEIRRQTDEQYLSGESQVAGIKTKGTTNKETEALLDQLQEFTKTLDPKRQLLEKINAIYTEYTNQLEAVQKDFTDFSGRVAEKIEQRRNRDLFERRANPLLSVTWGQVPERLGQSLSSALRIFSASFWSEQVRDVRGAADSFLVGFFLLLAITQFLLWRLRKWCLRIEESAWAGRHPWGCMVLSLFHRSLPLLGAVVLLAVYSQVRHLGTIVPLFGVVTSLLVIWLFTRWPLDLLRLWNLKREEKIPGPLGSRARRLVLYFRLFLIVRVLMIWIMGYGLHLLFWRVLFEIVFLGWSLSFLKALRKTTPNGSSNLSKGRKFLLSTLVGLGYIIPVGGLFLELVGYGRLAHYWYLSWGRTSVLVLWGGLLLLFIREQAERHRQGFTGPERLTQTAQPIHWFLIQISRLIWFGAFCLGLLFAWGATESIIIGFFKVFYYPIHVGQMQLSLLGVLYSVLILLCTSAATRLWRHILKEKILQGSGLELGLRESITTISVYFLWTLGILTSLFAFGLSMTSLAVAFGALGIGLGFGLQAIFNNFVSGLILLFERPIQVGDVVEIGGTWGTITKINVRSTVVQTYDNASLIIPNSEFVSSQLTNWSFKDLRVRRSVAVGVAYGSDVEKVRETLLETAENHRHILKVPKPDVLFTDFADSALVFKIRFWTTIDFALSTETDLRFEIDRLFREREIQIPFPQRDVHFISGMEKFGRSSEGLDEMEANSAESAGVSKASGARM